MLTEWTDGNGEEMFGFVSGDLNDENTSLVSVKGLLHEAIDSAGELYRHRYQQEQDD